MVDQSVERGRMKKKRCKTSHLGFHPKWKSRKGSCKTPFFRDPTNAHALPEVERADPPGRKEPGACVHCIIELKIQYRAYWYSVPLHVAFASSSNSALAYVARQITLKLSKTSHKKWHDCYFYYVHFSHLQITSQIILSSWVFMSKVYFGQFVQMTNYI